MNELTNNICRQIGEVILGKDEIIRKVLTAILAEGHVLLEDVPGVGKTTLAVAFAKTLGLSTKRVQFTSDTLPSDITGFSVFNRETGALEYQPGALNANLLLADELNRTSSKTQSALLEAMEERRVTVDGKTYALPKPFIVLATENPVGSAGTTLLPPSQLDRFLLCLTMGYPDPESETAMLKERHHTDPLAACKRLTNAAELMKLVEMVRLIHVDDSIYTYVSALLAATRKHQHITLGVSPRGGLALCRTAKAHAFLSGRDYVTPQDITDVFPDVCAHRIVLTQKARLHDHTAKELLAEILNGVKQPGVVKF